MLGLTLREEFRRRRLKGTQIELPQAVKLPAADFLRITYPTGDVLKALEAIGPGQGRPVVLMSERGQGKSHLMAALVHALNDRGATRAWLDAWADRLHRPELADLPLREGMHVISENLHRQNYKFLWDLLFERHPKGEYFKGKWEALGDRKTNVPSYRLLVEMFEAQPTALILDEFQTWFDGLTDSRRHRSRTWAFNFVQILSEIAKERPELLVLVVSLRNGDTEAYRQIHRVNPILVDWKGQHARRDRQRLLLHRLFENRQQVSPDDIDKTLAAHVDEYIRLLGVPPADRDEVRRRFVEAWPYAPHLLQLLEDQVLVATSAQETRDLIRILADLFKRRGDKARILTAADFRLDDDKSGIASLLDSVSNHDHQRLREKALRNLEAVRQAVADPDQVVPHVPEIVSALWVRSIAVGNQAGATAPTLQVDITRDAPIGDNTFQDELALIVENSFNIHQLGDRLIFRDEENPRARLMASARNDRLWAKDQPMGGRDFDQLAAELRYVLGSTTNQRFRVIVLGPHWREKPWEAVDEADNPARWSDGRIPLVVLPEYPDKLDERLGTWLKEHVQQRRNTVRFLLPRADTRNIYFDRTLVVLARAVCLAGEWKTGNREYGKLQRKYEGELRNILKKRFDRFAILATWDYADPARCTFHVESHQASGTDIPDAVDKKIREQLFVPEDFEELVVGAAENADSVAKLLGELQEPRPNGEDCIAWIGETAVKERIERLCARGKIAIDLRGSQYLQAREGEDEESAWRRIRGKLPSGRHLAETKLMLPQAVPETGGVAAGSGQPGSGGMAPQPPAPASSTLFPGESSDTDAGSESGAGGAPPGSPGGGDLFAGGTTTTLSFPANSALNLLARLESTGITDFTQVRRVVLTVEDLTGAKLNELLRKLPDGARYALEVEKEDG